MSEHIDVVKRAIEFNKPGYLPMEIVDVPGVYNAYHTLDPDTVQFIPGTETFDALWTCCYSWLQKEIGKTPQGESLRRDQFGTLLKTPLDKGSAYAVLEHALAGKDSLEGYAFPNPDGLDPQYRRLGNVIREKYPDRFVDAFIDPGIFLTTHLLIGLEDFLIKVANNIDFVIDVYGRVMEYYTALIPKYKRAGAHMITVIEDLGSTSSLLINPNVWRKHFKPLTAKFINAVHEEGLYAGMLIDGNSKDVLDDLLDLKLDVFTVVDMKTTGLDVIREKLKGKMCIKAAVDMQSTLAVGSPQEVEEDAVELVQALHAPEGGFISQVVRWHRPEYPSANVLASVEAFNRYRNL